MILWLVLAFARGGQAATTSPTDLAVRSSPDFGTNIIGTIKAGEKFKLLSRDMCWFAVDFPKQPAYVYVAFSDSESGGGGAPQVREQLNIIQSAYNLLDLTGFPYDPATQDGNLGCAQVASTILKDAGTVGQTRLNVKGVMEDLQAKGWQVFPGAPTPYKDGDVVTWATYNPAGAGLPPAADTHIGIVVVENGTAYAINNSSDDKRPEKQPLATYPAPVSHVLRMPGL